MKLLFCLLVLGAPGCNGPDVVVHPRYTPTGETLGQGAGRRIRLNVRDSRQKKGKTTASGDEILAAGDKGRVFLKSPYEEILTEGLRHALEATGFEVASDAPIVIDADLRVTELDAREFTNWKLDSETGSTLDAFRVVLPGKVRPTKAVTELTLVIRKHDRRLGLSHYVRKEAIQESRERSVIENVLNESLTATIEEAARKAAPEIEVAAIVPVSPTELRQQARALTAQEEGLRNLQSELQARKRTLDNSREAFLDLQRDIESENRRERAAVKRERERLAAERANVEAQQSDATRRSRALAEALAKTQKEARRDAAMASKLEGLLAQQNEVEALQRELDSQRRQLGEDAARLEDQEQVLAAERRNLDEKIHNIAEREEQNRRLQERIESQKRELALRVGALERWERDLERRAEVEPPAPLVKTTAPLIILTHPETSAVETSRSGLQVRGLVVAGSPIRDLHFEVNDVPLEGGRGPSALETATAEGELYKQSFLFDVTLSPGPNRVVVRVTDAGGNQSSESFEATYKQDPGEIHLVAVGIDRYKHEQKVPALKFAARDAKLVVETLQRGLEIPQKNIQLLTNDSASLRDIRLALGRRLWSTEGKEDTVLIYFSGHGAPEADSASPDGIEKYLLPYDADPDDFSATALPMDDIARIFQRLESERVVFLADTCYSGAVGGRTFPTRGRSFRALILESVDRRLEGAGRVILTASKGSEVAQELDDLGHGVFTYYVVEGLRKAADSNRDRTVTINELYDYVSRMVPAKTGGSQHPQLHQDRLVGDIVVGVIR